jgi:ribosome-binding factor A
MTNNSRLSAIKRGQKESLLAREVSQLLIQAAKDYPALRGCSVTRAGLSSDKSVCTVYFFSTDGQEAFNECFGTLKLIKPSLRHALSQKIRGRYVPELVFRYDHQIEKQQEIETLFEELKEAGEL